MVIKQISLLSDMHLHPFLGLCRHFVSLYGPLFVLSFFLCLCRHFESLSVSYVSFCSNFKTFFESLSSHFKSQFNHFASLWDCLRLRLTGSIPLLAVNHILNKSLSRLYKILNIFFFLKKKNKLKWLKYRHPETLFKTTWISALTNLNLWTNKVQEWAFFS